MSTHRRQTDRQAAASSAGSMDAGRVVKSGSTVETAITELEDRVHRAEDVPPHRVAGWLMRLAAFQSGLAARLLANIQTDPPSELATHGSRLMTVSEVATMLSVPKSYIYDLARRGHLPTVRFGKYVRIPLADLGEWVARHKENPLDTALPKPIFDSHPSPLRRKKLKQLNARSAGGPKTQGEA